MPASTPYMRIASFHRATGLVRLFWPMIFSSGIDRALHLRRRGDVAGQERVDHLADAVTDDVRGAADDAADSRLAALGERLEDHRVVAVVDDEVFRRRVEECRDLLRVELGLFLDADDVRNLGEPRDGRRVDVDAREDRNVVKQQVDADGARDRGEVLVELGLIGLRVVRRYRHDQFVAERLGLLGERDRFDRRRRAHTRHQRNPLADRLHHDFEQLDPFVECLGVEFARRARQDERVALALIDQPVAESRRLGVVDRLVLRERSHHRDQDLAVHILIELAHNFLHARGSALRSMLSDCRLSDNYCRE